MMQEGLLWFDADPKRDLAEKVARAADRYRHRFGQRPNLCYINPVTLSNSLAARPGSATRARDLAKVGSAELTEVGPAEYNGVQLVPSPNVLKNHFWIGVGEMTD